MSEDHKLPAPAPLPPAEQPEGLAFEKYLETSKRLFSTIRKFDYRRFFQDILTFLSILIAYFFVSLTYQLSPAFQQLIGLNLRRPSTLPHLLFVFSLYLIGCNLLSHFLRKRAEKLPPKKDEYEENVSDEPVVPTLEVLPPGERHYHEIVNEAIDKSIYFFLLIVAVAAYAFFNQPNKINLPSLVEVERVALLGVWFLAGNFLYLVGGLLEKVTKMSEFKTLGVALAFIVGFLSIGLANGLNTFIFI